MPGDEFRKPGHPEPPSAAGRKVEANALSDAARRQYTESAQEIASIAARLCALIPVGTSFVLQFDTSSAPQIVMADGRPVGRQVEMIQIMRPATFLAQGIPVRTT